MGQLHVFFLPFMAQGHILPVLDMANLFTSRGVKVTVIATSSHAPNFIKATQRSRNLGFDISIRDIKFPSAQVGLPEGIESPDQLTGDQMLPKFLQACALLRDQVEQLLQQFKPHCLVADMFFPWAVDAAAKFDVPTLSFQGMSTFALCVQRSLRIHKPHKNVSSDSEPFVFPDLPHQIKLTRGEIAPFEKEDIQNDFTDLLKQMKEAGEKCYGAVFNSFNELEPDYADYYKQVMGKRAWHVGPFLLCNSNDKDKAERGNKSAIDTHECLKWLDSKNPNSVVYICFGSLVKFRAAQLKEIALGLEAAGQNFIWAVRKCSDEEDSDKWFPEGFEEKMVKSGKGLIIKGWAPQVAILEHEAVGGFVTHCGWNSTLEGISAGLPFVTWPVFAEQFVNEKLVIDVLKIGVAVGNKTWSRFPVEIIKKEAISEAVNRVIEGEGALEMRGRARALKMMAKKAVEEGGSSYEDLSALLEDLSSYHSTTKQD